MLDIAKINPVLTSDSDVVYLLDILSIDAFASEAFAMLNETVFFPSRFLIPVMVIVAVPGFTFPVKATR